MRLFALSLLLIQLSVPLTLATPSVDQYDTSADGKYMVICTADGLKVIRVKDGAEMPQISYDGEHCLSCRLALLNFTLPQTSDLLAAIVTYPVENTLIEFEKWFIPRGTVVAANSARAPPRIS